MELDFNWHFGHPIQSTWYNFKTKEYVYSDLPTTDEQAVEYIPQLQAAQGLYKCYRLMGNDIIESMIKVLEACVGQEGESDVDTD